MFSIFWRMVWQLPFDYDLSLGCQNSRNSLQKWIQFPFTSLTLRSFLNPENMWTICPHLPIEKALNALQAVWMQTNQTEVPNVMEPLY